MLYRMASDRGMFPWFLSAMNCPPAFAYFSPHSRPCQRTRLCPFCWARAAAVFDEAVTGVKPPRSGVWSRVRDVVFPSNSTDPTKPARPENGVFDLVLMTRRLVLPASWPVPGGGSVDALESVLGAYTGRPLVGCPEQLPSRSYLLDEIPHRVGAFTTLTLAPRGDGWEVVYRELHAILPGAAVPGGSTVTGHSIRVARSPRIDDATALVGRLCTYPRGLLFGPVPCDVGREPRHERLGFPQLDRIDHYLRAVEGRRLWEGHGIFRNPRKAEVKPRRSIGDSLELKYPIGNQ
jgi:hypothetical protein